jgi:hypothetical protein
MNVQRDPDAVLATWLEEGPNRLPEQTHRAISFTTRTTPQRRHAVRLPWRFTTMSTTFKLAVGAAVVIAVVLGGAFVLGPRARDQGVGGGQTPSPSPTVSPSPSPSAAADPLDIATWTTYTSKQYGFSIAHPADWTVDPASRAWTWDDAPESLNPAQENFHSADGHVRVSAWSVPRDAAEGTIFGTPAEGWGAVEEWVQTYCERTGSTPCTDIHGRAVPLCLEKRDCHPGLLVPFDNDVQAFFTNGGEGAPMTVVAVWWGDSEPAVAPYGGSRRLLEAFLSTMDVWQADMTYPENGDAAATFLTTEP